MRRVNNVAIVGTAGIPANYGGFETLAENLARHHEVLNPDFELEIFCSTKNYSDRPNTFNSCRLRYIPLRANGIQSIPYDIWSILSAVLISKADVVLVLGVSGAVILPIVRLISDAKIITNVDGIEWKREKWHRLAKLFLRMSERIAAKYSHVVIADNKGIADHIRSCYRVESEVIAYGGDHVFESSPKDIAGYMLPEKYIFLVCRIEKENNIELIVSAFESSDSMALVIVGNWSSNSYGIQIRDAYKNHANITLLDPIYDLGVLRSMRVGAKAIVHGHSAGGTNPSLVEAMWFGKPIIAFDCVYNRYSTENVATYFSNKSDLIRCIDQVSEGTIDNVGVAMAGVAKKNFTWDGVARDYFALIKSHVKL